MAFMMPKGKKILLLSLVGFFSIFREEVFYELSEDIFSFINGESILQMMKYGEQSSKGKVVQKILKSMENSSSEYTRGARFCLYILCFAQSGYIWFGAKARERKTLQMNVRISLVGGLAWWEGGVDFWPKLCSFKSSGHGKVKEMGH